MAKKSSHHHEKDHKESHKMAHKAKIAKHGHEKIKSAKVHHKSK